MLTFVSAGLGMIAALAGPALLAVYFFRHRHRRVEVSSLLLWQSVARVREGGRTVKRTRLPWLFFVELLFLALCGLAVAGPRWLLPDSRRPLVVVVDDSASMGASTGRHNRLEEARRVLRATARDRRWKTIRYILAGPEARRFDTLESLMAEWSAAAPHADLADALRMARSLAGGDGQVLVVSDRGPGGQVATGDAVRWVAVGRPASNTAIVQAVRSPRDADSDYCLLGVAEYGPAARDAVVVVEWEQAPPQRIAVALQPGTPEFRTIVAPRGTGIGRFRLEGTDALVLDDAATLVPSPRKRVPVAVAVADEALATPVQAALDAAGTSLASDPATAALAIVDGDDALPTLASDAWVVRLRAPATARSLLGPFLRRSGHLLLEGMDLQGTAWGAASDLVLAGEPILRAGNTALVAVGGDGRGGQRIELQFTPARSTLQRTPDWPVLFANLLSWRWSQLPPGLDDYNVRSGLSTTLRAPAGVRAMECSWEQAAWTSIPVAGSVGPGRSGAALPTVLWTPRQPGLHRVRWAGGESFTLGANLLSPEESDLRNGATGEWGAWREADATGRGPTDVAWILLLAGLLVLVLHHALVSGRSLTPSLGSAPRR